MVNSRSRVPEVRSRTIVTEVTRNMMTNGKIPSICGPIRLNTPGLLSKTYLKSSSRIDGRTTINAMLRGS